MSTFSPERLPKDTVALTKRTDARAILDAYRSFLKSPAFENNVDLAVLTKLAADEAVPVRERRRSAEMLLRYRLRAMETLASIEGVREQILHDLGIDASTKNVSMTQLNTKIEIVRADDWRAAAPLEEGAIIEAEVVSSGETPADKSKTNGSE